VRWETLTSRGQRECITIEANKICPQNRGRLVHVQGTVRGVGSLSDPQFKDAVVQSSLKLQGTVEVFEWVQNPKGWRSGKESRTQLGFHQEWTTTHQDSSRFRKPSAENPRLVFGLKLGTHTEVSRQVELGAFTLPNEQVSQFLSFEQAMPYLPKQLHAHNVTFVANPEDGYFYGRPGLLRLHDTPSNIATNHQVGDVRVRFLIVPEKAATIVAVQCQKNGMETFIPYRPVPRSPCISDRYAREQLLEEGNLSLLDRKSESGCCTGGSCSSCLCCLCNLISACFVGEIFTEEIFFICDKHVPVEKPFDNAVPRSRWRLYTFRMLGWFFTFVAVLMLLSPFRGVVRSSSLLLVYGGLAHVVIAAMSTLAISAGIIAVASLVYMPLSALIWLCLLVGVISLPLIYGSRATS